MFGKVGKEVKYTLIYRGKGLLLKGQKAQTFGLTGKVKFQKLRRRGLRPTICPYWGVDGGTIRGERRRDEKKGVVEEERRH